MCANLLDRWLQWTIKALASCFYLSYLPVYLRRGRFRNTGAGLVGTAAGLLTARCVPSEIKASLFVLVGGVFVSVAVSDYAEELMRHKDDPRIVIDEWIGYWFTIAWLPQTIGLWAAAFVIFRVLDVWKPWLIRRVARLPGGWGVVMDDIVAGLAGNLLLRGLEHIHPL